MAFYNRFWRWFGSNATSNRYGSQDSTPNSTAHENTVNVGVDGAMQISTVWACVSLICENVASLPLNVYIKDAKTGQRTPVTGEDIYTILHDRPNQFQTAMEFWMVMLLNLILRGNGFARKQTNNKGEIISLWPLSADQMEVELTKGNKLLYHYWNGEVFIEYEEQHIFHLRGLGNGIIGMSQLDYMRSSVGLSINAQNHTNKTFNRSGRRPGILYTGGHILKPDQREQARKKFNDIVKGTENELYILEGEFKFEPLGMTSGDIQLLETRKFSVQDLARWFGVPSVLVNDTAETTSLGSSVEQIIDGFYKLKLRTVLQLIEQAIENRILTAAQRSKGMFVEFNMDALLRSSLKDRMEVYSQSVQNSIFLRNECRGWENLPPIPGGEIPTVQSNLLPLDKLGTQINTGGGVPSDPVRQ